MGTRQKVLIRVGAVVLLTLTLIYLAKLTGLVVATQRAAQDAAHLEAEVAALETSVESLETATVYSSSDAYVERWARDERKWARQGDHPVAPVPATSTASVEAQPEESTGESPWDRFLHWLGWE